MDSEKEVNLEVERIKDRCSVDARTGCWIWGGATHKQSGKPVMRHNGQDRYVSRVLWEIAKNAPLRRGENLVRSEKCTSQDPLCVRATHYQVARKEERLGVRAVGNGDRLFIDEPYLLWLRGKARSRKESISQVAMSIFDKIMQEENTE